MSKPTSYRVFMPDQPTPAQTGEPWQPDDVFAVQHGPDPRNLFFFKHVEPHEHGYLFDDGAARFTVEIAAYLERIGASHPVGTETKGGEK